MAEDGPAPVHCSLMSLCMEGRRNKRAQEGQGSENEWSLMGARKPGSTSSPVRFE